MFETLLSLTVPSNLIVCSHIAFFCLRQFINHSFLPNNNANTHTQHVDKTVIKSISTTALAVQIQYEYLIMRKVLNVGNIIYVYAYVLPIPRRRRRRLPFHRQYNSEFHSICNSKIPAFERMTFGKIKKQIPYHIDYCFSYCVFFYFVFYVIS